jgi:hypothetical protein
MQRHHLFYHFLAIVVLYFLFYHVFLFFPPGGSNIIGFPEIRTEANLSAENMLPMLVIPAIPLESDHVVLLWWLHARGLHIHIPAGETRGIGKKKVWK